MPPLAAMASSSPIDDAIQRKMCEWELIRTGKGITLVISNEYINVIIVTKSLENLGVIIDGVNETLKHEIKKMRSLISWHVVRNHRCFSIRKYIKW